MNWISIVFLLLEFLPELKFQDNIYIRKNAKDLTFNEWQDLKRGIKLMKSRHLRNPLGFDFQANIHGWSEYDGSDLAKYISDKFNWHKCSHSQYFFLIWHRMYIYFFEKILRAATGNPNFALPYWDYSDPHQREIPQPFRIPADEHTNPLYVEKRCQNINEGKPLPAEIVDPYPALKSRFFAANKSNELNVCHSFGGGRIDWPAFLSDREGLLERLPHDRIHVYMGGPNGKMADLCQASLDPIFWLNHCMVDRIWESWIKNGGHNLLEEPYLKQNFSFYDEMGRLGSYFVKDFLNITKLGYRYDSLLKTEKPIQMSTNERPELFVSVDETQDIIINSTKHSVILKISPSYYSLFDDIAKGYLDENKIRFTLQTVLAQYHSRLLFQLFLNLPVNTYPYEERFNFIGTITMFEDNCNTAQKRKQLGITHCFDITDNLFKIFKSEYNFNGTVPKYLNLTIVPKSCETTVYPEDNEFIIKFQRTLLIHYFPQKKQINQD